MRRFASGLLAVALLPACSTTPKTADNSASSTAAPVSAKDIFLADNDSGAKGLSVVRTASDAKPTARKNANSEQNFTTYQGVSYWIERLTPSGSQRVTASSTFHNGDRIRFHVQTNRPGYLYVVAQGSSGRSTYLFPTSAAENEFIQANTTYTIPSQAAIVFDAQPGQEVVWLFVSKQPLPAKTSADKTGGTPNTQLALNSCASKDLLLQSPDSLQNQCGTAPGGQAKDILIQDDIGSAAPAGYAVIPQQQMEQGAMLSLRLVLRHE